MTFKIQRSAHFCLCASTNPLPTDHNNLMIYCTKVHDYFKDMDGSTDGLSMGIGFCDLPNRCKNASTNNKDGECQLVAVSRHKIDCHGNVS